MSVAKLTPLAVIVLALLREGDMHPYEMIRLMRQRRDDLLVPITNGTVYHTVDRLERAGLLAEVRVDREGRRPERTTYTVTGPGRAAVEEWVRRELPRIDRPLQFRVALAEAHNLDRDEVLTLLRARHRTLAAARTELRAGLVDAQTNGVPAQVLIELDRSAHLADADLLWLDAVLAQIADGSIPWGFEQFSRTQHYVALREAARQ